MTLAANASVRERRRRSSVMDLEQMNIMKALTAAEHSRRQFVLNFAASKQTHLLIPGQKADAVKAAEEWVAAWLAQNGLSPVSSEFFKYTVDAQLWSTHVGSEVQFPFTFMRANLNSAPSSTSTAPEKAQTSLSPDDATADTRSEDQASLSSSPSAAKTELPEARRPRGSQQEEQTAVTEPVNRQRSASSKKRQPLVTETSSDKKRSLSLNSIDDYKRGKLSQDKFPLLVRLGRSWSRRMSST
ncbi:hypothetical protein QBC38DRAFT_34295 [Podospora fimiseda]|uniref:Uncharacterized protein n=1 Tax=Podospora fimiseda TaxID=252190 RepID=A0AAN7GPL2_9PEZI|nr:hypothetical protein QBC38DRAFT_34295 [Podospora fimiseda]